jgi:hypothetical protein
VVDAADRGLHVDAGTGQVEVVDRRPVVDLDVIGPGGDGRDRGSVCVLERDLERVAV